MNKTVQLEDVKAMTDEIEQYFADLYPQTNYPVEVDTMLMIEHGVKKIMLEHIKHMIKYVVRS
jgi:hypothetical protein